MSRLDHIENDLLIANGLQHMLYERSLPAPSYFRIAREAHLVLYRSMIEALKGTANLAVTGRLGKNPSFVFQSGREPWRAIHRVSVPGCRKAWRFSPPVPTTPPDLNRMERQTEPEKHLIGFYEALAMVQSECFMTQLYQAQPVAVDDTSMATLEWIHEDVRNEYEHFTPRLYSADIGDLDAAAQLCVRLARELLLNSGNVRLEGATEEYLRRLFLALAPVQRAEKA